MNTLIDLVSELAMTLEYTTMAVATLHQSVKKGVGVDGSVEYLGVEVIALRDILNDLEREIERHS